MSRTCGRRRVWTLALRLKAQSAEPRIFTSESERVQTAYLASIGSKGGKARAKALTKKEQRAIALKASKAAAKARRGVLAFDSGAVLSMSALLQ
jgi:hypothetical protein